MSIVLKKIVTICGKDFCDYQELGKHMQFLIAEYLKKTGVIDNKHLINALKSFKEFIVFGKNIGVYEYLLKENFQCSCVDLLKLCMENGDVKLLAALLSCIITMTDNSVEMCFELTENGLSELVIKETIIVCNSNSKLSFFKSATDDLFDQLILIVVNISKHARFQQSFFRCKDIDKWKEAILPYLTSRDHRTRILTVSALTFLILEEVDKSRLDFYSKIVENFVDYIKNGMRDEKRRYEGLRISILLTVLKSLSNIQSIKNFMLTTQTVLTIIPELLSSVKSTCEEKSIAMGILHNLGIENDQQSTKLQDVFSVEIYIQPLLESPDRLIQEGAEDILSELSTLTEKRRTEIRYDIFISCCTADKDKIETIANYFTNKDYVVAVPNENCKRSDINETIEQSGILLMGVSNSYYNDSGCHSECELARKLKTPIISLLIEPEYKPKDWLKEITIHCTKYIDFCEESDFKDLTEKLLKQVKVILDQVGGVKTSQSNKPPKVKSTSVNKSFMEEKEVDSWNNEEVAQWLEQNGLSHIQEQIVDGSTLDLLKDMKINSPNEYFKYLTEKLKMDSKDMGLFNKAIKKLII